jgi:methionyl aminopeptidase
LEKPIPLKTSLEVSYIRRACRLAETTLRALEPLLRPGIRTLDINRFCEKAIHSRGGRALKGYQGFPASVCTSVNQVACHGLPSSYVLQEGDLITVDISTELDGWCGDAAWTYRLGRGDSDARRLVKAAWQATLAGIAAARAGNRLGDVGWAIGRIAARYGCGVFENFAGHGIGQAIHEEPLVLPLGEPDTGRPIVPGMVFTVEPILTLGAPRSKVLGDGWSMVSEDGSLCAQFEHTLAVFSRRTEVLTLPAGEQEAILSLETPPF